MHPRSRGALSTEADASDLHRIVAVLGQAPKGTGPRGGVHLPDHTLARAILSLQWDMIGGDKRDSCAHSEPGPCYSTPTRLRSSGRFKCMKGAPGPPLMDPWMLREPRKDTGGGRTQVGMTSRGSHSYLLRNGVADDNDAFWDVPGHSGRVGSKLSDRHIHGRRRPVCRGRPGWVGR